MFKSTLGFSFLLSEDKSKLIGINLGYSLTAPNWGIDRLKYAFGIPLNPKEFGLIGFDALKATKTPLINFSKKKNFIRLICSESVQFFKKDPLEMESDSMVSSAWSDNSFGISGKGKDNISYIEEIYTAIQNQDICITEKSSELSFSFLNGLWVIIYSRIPEMILTKAIEI